MGGVCIFAWLNVGLVGYIYNLGCLIIKPLHSALHSCERSAYNSRLGLLATYLVHHMANLDVLFLCRLSFYHAIILSSMAQFYPPLKERVIKEESAGCGLTVVDTSTATFRCIQRMK